MLTPTQLLPSCHAKNHTVRAKKKKSLWTLKSLLEARAIIFSPNSLQASGNMSNSILRVQIQLRSISVPWSRIPADVPVHPTGVERASELDQFLPSRPETNLCFGRLVQDTWRQMNAYSSAR